MDHYIENTIEFIERKKDDVMISNLKKIILFFGMMATSLISFTQDKQVEMADTMRSNGRIYVVVAVVITILTGLILYVIRLDRKITKLEKDN